MTPQTISELVRGWAERTPHAVALSSLDGTRLTYGGLWGGLQLGELELRGLGIGRADRVALVLDDSPELAVAFLTVASAAACAPLNPTYREQELDFYLSDLGAAAVIVRAGTSSPARAVADRLGMLLVELESTEIGDGTFTLSSQGPARAVSQGGDSSTALLLHTSGTTARPKLVPLTHANLCTSATRVAASLALTPADRCLAVMPLFHIHGLVAAVLAPLAAGSSTIATRGFDGVRFLEWIETTHPTWYTAVPAMHMAVLERARPERERARAAGLRLVRSSSAPLPVPMLEGLEDVFDCPVIEAYGMTEAAHQMAANPLPPRARRPGSVGLAAGPEVAVLDAAGTLLGHDEVGEVAVRGPSVFGGYEANKEANRDAFADGWFRTGDQGFLDADGYLFLRGRLKEIINRGGEKVSPQEVEEAIRAHPAVADAVVFAQPHARLGEEVAAAIVLQNGTTATAPDLQRFAGSRLAPFKVPRTVTFLDALPRGPTGKVQRVGLSERLGLPTLGIHDHERPPYAEPRTSLERRLCELIEELLAVPRVGISDDFFALGGDSLHVAQLLAQIDEERGATSETPACVLLRAPTVGRLAALLEDDSRSNGRVFAVEPQRAGAPFFFFPTHEWATAGLGALAHRLECDHSVFTFQLDPNDLPGEDCTANELASMFVADIRTVQPDGPYYLGGHCFGAALALEAARVLESEGDDVAALVLVNPIGEHLSRLQIEARWIGLHARRGTLIAWIRRRLDRRRKRAEARERRPADAARMEAALAHARAAYAFRAYPGRVIVLAGADYLTPATFWEPLVRELDWRRVSGVTDALFRPPHVDALARELSDVLALAAGCLTARTR